MRVTTTLFFLICGTPGCTLFGAASIPCDVDGDCPPGERCGQAFCALDPAFHGADPVGADPVGADPVGADVDDASTTTPSDSPIGDPTDPPTGEGEGEGEGDPGAPLAASCAALQAAQPTLASGFYDLDTAAQGQISVYCDFDREGGGWTRVLRGDFAAGDACPSQSEWEPRTLGDAQHGTMRACGRPDDREASSAFFSSPVPYTEVLVALIAIPLGDPDAFASPRNGLDQTYVDGISVTSGHPRRHVFTFAASANGPGACPCEGGVEAPGFVGDRMVCEQVSALAEEEIADVHGLMFSGSHAQCAPADLASPVVEYGMGTASATATLDDVEVRLLVDNQRDDEDLGIALLEVLVR